MADAKPEVGIASTREQRRNAGNLMSKLIEDEQDVDDFYKTAFGGFEEESGDEQYDTEEEVEDVVDSDFSMSETDEVIDEGIDDEPKRKRKPVQVRSYKPRKLDDDTAESKEAKTTPRKTRRSDLPAREGIRKSTRSLTVERSQEHKKRLHEDREKRKQLKEKQQQRIPEGLRRLTQEELLAEAMITEEENVATLQAYQRLEADKKKSKLQKPTQKGPIIRFHSLSMPIVELEEQEQEVKVDGIDEKEDAKPEIEDSKKRCCRNFLIFTDAKSFPNAYFPTKKPKSTQRAYCPVTGLPARYLDPLTGLPYANAQAFRYIREKYALQAKEAKEKGATVDTEQRPKRRKAQ